MSMQPGSIDADGLARTTDGKLYVTAVGNAAITGGNTFFVTAASSANVSVPADTTLDQLVSLTLPALSVGSIVRGRTEWSYTNNADTKTLALKLGSTQIAAPTVTTTGIATLEFVFYNVASTAVQAGQFRLTTGNTLTGGTIGATEATGTGATFAILGQKNTSSADALTLLSYVIEVYKP